jgi:hypothetical protein
MAGEEDGILGGARGAIVPRKGLIVAETGPIGLKTPPPHVQLSRPAGACQEEWAWELRRYGKAEIGFCCDRYTPDDTKSVTEIRILMKNKPNVSACVLMSYGVIFPPRTSGSEVFQAFCRLKVSGPFLPLEVKNKTALRRVKQKDDESKDDPRMWENALERLLLHEKGHIKQAWKDLLSANFDFKTEFEDKDDLTYEEFKRVVIKSEAAMIEIMSNERNGSAIVWDNKDLGDMNSYIKDLYINMPIKMANETRD